MTELTKAYLYGIGISTGMVLSFVLLELNWRIL